MLNIQPRIFHLTFTLKTLEVRRVDIFSQEYHLTLDITEDLLHSPFFINLYNLQNWCAVICHNEFISFSLYSTKYLSHFCSDFTFRNFGGYNTTPSIYI